MSSMADMTSMIIFDHKIVSNDDIQKYKSGHLHSKY